MKLSTLIKRMHLEVVLTTLVEITSWGGEWAIQCSRCGFYFERFYVRAHNYYLQAKFLAMLVELCRAAGGSP